jgi:hypothetical protein
MLHELWDEFTTLAYPDRLPGYLRAQLDFELLDVEAVECVHVYLATGGLDPERAGVLRACQAELARVVPELHHEAGAYFGTLERLSALVLERVNARRPLDLA